ncbi:MAG: hypothetical protein O2817_11925 [Proteobacteria bacterium]|nr:hypothetical protein [Pseudomonadota bacterium]
MTTKLVTWASNNGQVVKIKQSDGCGKKTIMTTAQFGYDHHGFEAHLGNVG